MSLQSFIADLRRRRVFRVAGVYAVVAWIAIQVADTVLPRLGAPDWAVTLVIVLAAAGLVLAIGLAWVFDITSDGIERTSADPALGAAPTSRPVPRRAAWFAAGIIVSLSLGWYVVKNDRPRTADLDSKLITVLPFRVSGATQDVAYLREGMLDMFAATLVNSDGTRAVDPATTLTHWNRAVGDDKRDLPVDSARALARILGSKFLLVGSVVGKPAQITVSIELIDAEKGDVLARSTKQGSADSISQIVEHLAGDVLAATAGEAPDRQSLLAGVPLPAIRAYLDAGKAFRRGDFTVAARQYEAAFGMDSTFVLAAIGVEMITRWGGHIDAATIRRAREVFWTHHDRLAPVDRAYVMAALGPHYPAPSSIAERMAAVREMYSIAPDRTDTRFMLADYLYHYGGGLGISDAHEQSAKLIDGVLRDDPTLDVAKVHRMELAMEAGDTATVQRLAAEVIAKDPKGELAPQARWYSAAMRSDTATLRDILARSDNAVNFYALGYHPLRGGIALEDADAAIAVLMKKSVWPGRFNLAFQFALDRGQVAHAKEILAEARASGDTALIIPVDLTAVSGAIYGGYDVADAARSAARLQSFVNTQRGNSARMAVLSCIIAEWDVSRNRFVDVAPAIKRLRSLRDSTNSVVPHAAICADFLDARLAVHDRRPDAATKLKKVDNQLADMPAALGPSDLHSMNLAVATMYEELGDREAALRAVRRRNYYIGDAAEYLPAARLVEGRIAAAMGQRDAAIHAYRHYLTLMDGADPIFKPSTDGVQRELQRLLGDASARR